MTYPENGDPFRPEHLQEHAIDPSQEFESDGQPNTPYFEVERQAALLVMKRLQQLYPDDYEVYRDAIAREWAPGEMDGLAYEIELMLPGLVGAFNREDNEELAGEKLAAATKFVTEYPPEVHAFMLQAIDIVAPASVWVGELDNEEIRSQNLTYNGGSPERESYYRHARYQFREQFKDRFAEVFREVYGDHADFDAVVLGLLTIGTSQAVLEWERSHTSDATQEIRDVNYDRQMRTLDIFKRVKLDEEAQSFLDSDQVESALGLINEAMTAYLSIWLGENNPNDENGE